MKKIKLVLGIFCLFLNHPQALKAMDEGGDEKEDFWEVYQDYMGEERDEVAESVWKEYKEQLIERNISTEEELESLKNQCSSWADKFSKAESMPELMEAKAKYWECMDKWSYFLDQVQVNPQN